MIEPKRTDANQKVIVSILRKFRCAVTCIHTVGYGCPDLVVGLRGLSLVGDFNRAEAMRRLEGLEGLTVHQGVNLLLEVKNPDAKGGWRMTSAEKRWHKFWKGQKAVVETPIEALKLCGKKVLG